MALLIYGATGYTGELLVRYAKEAGMSPIVSGRNEQKVANIGNQYDLPFRVASLDDHVGLKQLLQGVKVVLNAAGPFSATAQPMMEACLEHGVHYLDITGEIEVFELGHALDGAAQAAEILLLPGVGFDVVPTDCIAAFLHQQLPEASHLQLAFTQKGGGVSHGTAYTMAESLGEGGAVRKNGKITRVPLGHKTLTAPFKGMNRFCMTIPWGDVSTAYYSTGILNIETYFGVRPKTHRWIRRQKYVNWLLRTNLVRNMVKGRIDRAPAGPSDASREKGNAYVWGKVTDEEGNSQEARLVCPDGYTLTAIMGLHIAQKVLDGQVPVGFQTPATAYGHDLILEVPGVERECLIDGEWKPC